MNCLGHNPTYGSSTVFLCGWTVKLKYTCYPSLPLPDIQWWEGKYRHSSSKSAKDICVCLWQLETGATGLL